MAAGNKTWGSQQPFLSSGLPVCKMGMRASELQLRAPEPSTGQLEIGDSRVQKLVGSPGARQGHPVSLAASGTSLTRSSEPGAAPASSPS